MHRRCARRRRINHRYRDDYRRDHESGRDGCGAIVQVRYRNSQNNNNLFLISHFYFIPCVGNTDAHSLHRIGDYGRRERSMEPISTDGQNSQCATTGTPSSGIPQELLYAELTEKGAGNSG